MRLLFCFLAAFLLSDQVEAQPASDELAAKRALELLDMAAKGKDGSYEVMKKFAECAGMYNALADHLVSLNSQKMATSIKGSGRGAYFAARYFWSPYSKNSKAAVIGISGGSEIYYSAILSHSGATDKIITEKMFYCGSLTSLQAKIIDQIRKTY